MSTLNLMQDQEDCIMELIEDWLEYYRDDFLDYCGEKTDKIEKAKNDLKDGIRVHNGKNVFGRGRIDLKIRNKCIWKTEYGGNGLYYETGCKDAFQFDFGESQIKHGFKYCPYCSKEIYVIEESKDDR